MAYQRGPSPEEYKKFSKTQRITYWIFCIIGFLLFFLIVLGWI